MLLAVVVLQAKAQFVDIDWSVYERDSILSQYYTVLELGDDYMLYDYKAHIEYPEFKRMSDDEVRRYGLEAIRDSLPAYPCVETSVNVSAKQGMLDVCFVPIVCIENVFYRVDSFKLVVESNFNITAAMSRIATRATSASRYADNSQLAEGKWVKIAVKENGVHKITHSELSRMGFKNPDKVRLFGYGGHLLPEANIHELSDDLQEIPLWRESEYVLFYADAIEKWEYKSGRFAHTRNHYSEYGCYFLNESDAEPKQFSEESLSNTSGKEYSTYPDYAVYEKDKISLCTYGRVLLDNYDYATGRTASYNFNIEGVASETATIDVAFGSNALETTRVAVEVNGNSIGSLSLQKASSSDKGKISQVSLSIQTGFSDNPKVKLTHNTDNSSITGFLDFIRLNFTRNLALYGSNTLFRGNVARGNAKFNISKANTTTHVWHVTEPAATVELFGTLDGDCYSVVAPASRNEKLVVVDVNGSFPSVTVLGNVPNQNLHALRGLDFVIIVPSNGNFIQAAERLAQAHLQYDGLSTVVVTAEQVYNEFSSGTPDATAYRRFMKMLYDRAESSEDAPKYLLLFGDGLTDNRLITYPRQNKDNLLLTYQSENSVSTVNSYVLEDYYGFLDDSEKTDFVRNKLDISIGRIPAQTVEDANGVVDKIIAYMKNETSGPWQNVITLMADDGDKDMPNVHMTDAEKVASELVKGFPAFMIDRIYWDNYKADALATGLSYPLVTEAIYNRLEQGALIMNYSGHGSSNLLSHEMAWKASDMAAVSYPNPPFWVTASCDIAPFDMGDLSVGETAILNPKGAAIGLFTTTRTVFQNYNNVINIAFMKQILTLNDDASLPSIGDAIRKAKCEVIASNTDVSINKLQFVLMGDPALRLNMPQYKVIVEKFNGNAITELGQVAAGGSVTVEGYVAKTDGTVATDFTGFVSPILFDCIEEITTLDNMGIGAYNYTAYTNKLFTGSDSVKNGRFKLSIPVPLDISYRNEQGMMNFFAIDTHGVSAQGYYDNFNVGGTASTLSDDNRGPEIKMYLNSPDFVNGDEVNATPCLFAELSDESGINTVGTGIGHDLMVIIDNDIKYTYKLNNKFTLLAGDYKQGSLQLLIDELPAGDHSLILRAWDVYNNSSVDTLYFTVVPDLAPELVDVKLSAGIAYSGQKNYFTITHNRPYNEVDITLELFNFQGQMLWQYSEKALSDGVVSTVEWDVTGEGGQPLPTGVYLYRAKLSSGGSSEQTKTRKIIVLNNK